MLCISVSYKKTEGELRQRFAFSEEEQKTFLKRLMDAGVIDGGVILSTCNRSELYVTVRNSDDKAVIGFAKSESGRRLKQLEEIFSEYKGLSRSLIRKNCLFYQGKQAVMHLYRVVCGLDSMVLGEDEILHQTKHNYKISQSIGAANGEINIIFQGAFNCAKLSKSETRISETPVSIGTLTANCIEEYLKNQQCDRVMVIGASGQIGSIVAKNLIAKNMSVIGTSRSHHSGEELWSCTSHEDLTWIDFSKRYEYINEVSAVVSATKSPHYTITRDEFCKKRDFEKPLLLVDLAVPYDIDRDIEEEKNITLMGIDHFKELSEKNSAIKLSEAEKMSVIVSECVEDVLKRLYIRNFQVHMVEQEDWFSKMIFYLKEALDSDTLLKVLEKIYNR